MPVVRRMRRYRPPPPSPAPDPPTFEVEIEYRHRDFGWLSIVLMTAFTVGLGFYAYTQHPVTIFFPGETKWVFWLMAGSLGWIVIDKLMDAEE